MTRTESNPAVERMSIILAEAPEDIKPVLVKIKMEQDRESNMKSLSNTAFNTELLSKTLAYLMKCDVSDERITRVVRKGKGYPANSQPAISPPTTDQFPTGWKMINEL